MGGFEDSQLDISDFAFRSDSILVSTFGAGVYVRPLRPGGTWHHFGEAFEPNKASDVRALAVGGTRLVAAAGGNGTVFDRGPADAEWSESFLNNVGIGAGNQAKTTVWNGATFVVGSTVGVFRSPTGHGPWVTTGPGLGALLHAPFAAHGRTLLAAFDRLNDVVMAASADDGETWDEFDRFAFKFVYALAVCRGDIFVARRDGLFRLADALAVPRGEARAAIGFSLAGRNPARDLVRFRIDLPEGGAASIDVYDVTGRRVADAVRFVQPAGRTSWRGTLTRSLPASISHG